jgi:hypothetical protein
MNDESSDIAYAIKFYKIKPKCEYCGHLTGLKLESSRTKYFWEGPLDSTNDPNRMRLLCRCCAEEHHSYWNDMWEEYYRGRL